MAADLELGNYPYKNLGEDNYDSGITVAQSSLQIRLGKSFFHWHLFSMTRNYTELASLPLNFTGTVEKKLSNLLTEFVCKYSKSFPSL